MTTVDPTSKLPADLRGEIERRARFIAVPDRTRDLSSDDAASLRAFLPLPTDRALHPREFQFLKRVLGAPMTPLQAGLAFAAAVPDYRLNYRSLALPGQFQGSANWSGGYVTPKDGRRIVALFGTWKVPTPKPPAQVPAGVTEFHSSAWIGIDGQRRYLHSSLPQIGTSHTVREVNGQWQARCEAWWQWWVREEMHPPVTLPLAVKPNDQIMAGLIVLDPHHVLFLIANRTTHQIAPPAVVTAPLKTMPSGPSPQELRVSGATAEWVLERPTRLNSDELYHLADYGALRFEECFAVEAGSSGLRVQDLVGAKLIDMYEVRDHPNRTVDISIARQADGGTLKATYR